MTLRTLVLASVLALSTRLGAEEIVVVSSGHSEVLASSRPADGPDFRGSVARALSGAASFDASFPLIQPPAWGRIVSKESGGRLDIRRSFAGGFLFRLELLHLQPSHTYVLCINGRPAHPGNELLPEAVPGNAAEKYYDFHTVTTDAEGSYHGSFGLALKAGAYNVHFYVKDTTDHKIILYGLEYFDFEVR